MPASLETVQNRLHYVKMNGPEVFRFATRITSEISTRVLKKRVLHTMMWIYLFPTRPNLRIIKTAMKRMNIPAEKTLINLDMYGNISLLPVCPWVCSQAHEEGRLQPGDLVLMVAFGAGLTFGGIFAALGEGLMWFYQ